jgi:hypothetical protein
MSHSTWLFMVSLILAAAGPLLALWWLQPLLVRVLSSLCQADGGALFWVRTAQILAVSGSLILLLLWGQFDEGVGTVDSLRRTLWLVLSAVFFSVALVSRQVWAQVRRMLIASAASADPRSPQNQQA